MYISIKSIFAILTIIVFADLMGCKDEQIVSASDENKQEFHLSFNSREQYKNNEIVGYVIEVSFKTFNTKEIPILIINQDTISNLNYNSLTKSISGYAIIKDTISIDFQIINSEKITKGNFYMPDEVKNVTCNGFKFKPLIELENDSVYHYMDIASDSVYSISWLGNSDYYSLKVNSWTFNYSGRDTSFFYRYDEVNYGSGRPGTIEATSYKGYPLKIGDEPNYKGTYGSGYVYGSRTINFRYEP